MEISDAKLIDFGIIDVNLLNSIRHPDRVQYSPRFWGILDALQDFKRTCLDRSWPKRV
jgi:hypothetical protein